MEQAKWPGSCSAAVAGLGFGAGGTVAADEAAGRRRSPWEPRWAPVSGLGGCTGGTSASSPAAWVLCPFCCGSYHWAPWAGFAVEHNTWEGQVKPQEDHLAEGGETFSD